jgi:mannonate dehydratase
MKEGGSGMNRRSILKMAGSLTAGAIVSLGEKGEAFARNQADKTQTAENTYSKATRGLPPLKITKVKTIMTCPQGGNYVVVKVETSEPGLYGVGSATLTTRGAAVATAMQEFLTPFAIGKDPAFIEDIWQTAYVSSYWRNGPVLNGALCGLDEALWDIKGKRANMPVYELLGGKSRFALTTYCHADGKTVEAVSDNVSKFVEAGWKHVRVQLGGYGGSPLASSEADFKAGGFGQPTDELQQNWEYMKGTYKLLDYIRQKHGEDLELIHDMHERLEPNQAVEMVKNLEKYRMFYAEDALAPEQEQYFKMIRAQCTTPISMGELFSNPLEWTGLISDRLIDFIRVGFNHVGGITPGLKIARLSEAFGVRTAWHGPGNIDPINHAAQGHVDLTIPNFGIQEDVDLGWGEKIQEVFPGCPQMKKGYMYINEAPGIGVDINEEIAAKYPFPPFPRGTGFRFPARKEDGTQIRP